MQHGRERELIGDILENALAVLRREREFHGRPVGDVIINLETALVRLEKLQEERSPFQTLRESPFEANDLDLIEVYKADAEGSDRTMQERHPIDREAARKGFTE